MESRGKEKTERIIRENAAFELALKAKTKTSRARPTERREAGWVNHQAWERRKRKKPRSKPPPDQERSPTQLS